MKKKIKYRVYSTILSTVISLASCSNKTAEIVNGQNIEVYDLKNEIGEEDLESNVNTNENKSAQDFYVTVTYDEEFNELEIVGENQKHNQFDKLSKDFYQQLNKIIQEKDITNIYLCNLDDTFDFARINTSNIKEIKFKNCKGNINLKDNDFSQMYEIHFSDCEGSFNGIDTEIISLFNTNFNVIENYLLESDMKETLFYWTEDGTKSRNLKSFLKFLLDNNINIGKLSIDEMNSQEYDGITEEEFDLLSKLNVRDLYIEDEGFKNTINLDLSLNKSIQNLYFESYYRTDENEIINSKLGNIRIKTNSKKFNCNFSKADITKNTHFSLPNSTWLSLENLECKDISAFNELSNVEFLWFKEYLGKGLMADTEGSITYCRDSSFKFFDAITNEEEKVFREYNEFLNYLKICNKLKNIQEKLDISEEYERDQEIISIGDIVNLKNENTPIYESRDSNNSTTSYYGTSELRCICSIVLAKDNYEIEVDNMDDYELFTELGFIVKRYNLINQYSLNKDGSLTTELYCNKDGVQLVRTPFN